MIHFTGSEHAISIFGITLVGVSVQTGTKILFTIVFLFVVFLLRRFLKWIDRRLPNRTARAEFWTDQGIRLAMAALTIIGLVSIWFNNPSQLTTVIGLVGAGVAFALQKVITAIAAYFVLLRGKTFNVGDRISMGGVRGDVIALGFIQTTIMEMGEPPSVQSAEPAMWVQARQYTGRIVTVTNDKIFDQPVYNFTRDFPYLWEEMQIPIGYKADRKRAEEILLDVARRHTVKVAELSESALQELERRYFMRATELQPRVYWRLTDNWIELTVRFITRESGIRELKDSMSREIIYAFDREGIGIASSTYDIVGFPPIRMEAFPPPQNIPQNTGTHRDPARV